MQVESYYVEIPAPFSFFFGVPNHLSFWCEFHLQTLVSSALSGRAKAVLNHHFQNLHFASSAIRIANEGASNMAHFFHLTTRMGNSCVLVRTGGCLHTVRTIQSVVDPSYFKAGSLYNRWTTSQRGNVLWSV